MVELVAKGLLTPDGHVGVSWRLHHPTVQMGPAPFAPLELRVTAQQQIWASAEGMFRKHSFF